jgi:hypothetical protein
MVYGVATAAFIRIKRLRVDKSLGLTTGEEGMDDALSHVGTTLNVDSTIAEAIIPWIAPLPPTRRVTRRSVKTVETARVAEIIIANPPPVNSRTFVLDTSASSVIASSGNATSQRSVPAVIAGAEVTL